MSTRYSTSAHAHANANPKAKRAFRIASLLVPSALAWYVAFSAPHTSELARVVTLALGPLWLTLAATLIVRMVAILVASASGAAASAADADEADEPVSALAQIDVLTSSGSALAWSSAFAIAGAVWIGWASLAAVGLLGTGLFHVVVLLAFFAFRSGGAGGSALRGAAVERCFSPGTVTEGEDVVEEIRFTGLRIPLGFRMFVTGSVGRRWATSRYVIDDVESGADEIKLESEIGPAVRGQLEAEPLTLWLEDSFGLCRSPLVRAGAASLTVLPRLRTVDKSVPLMARGTGPRAPRTAARLPTEGSFELREYQPGDDVRRIHWVRSISAGELIVRLPDELPPDRPRVRLILDTFFPEALVLSSDVPSEALDAIVGVWLAVGRALAESGVRVTLVTSLAGSGQNHEMTTARPARAVRDFGPALRLGAQVAWQNQDQVEALMTDEASLIVSRGILRDPPPELSPRVRAAQRWIIVAPDLDTQRSWPSPASASMHLPYPMGSSENRWSRQRRFHAELVSQQEDDSRAILALRTGFPPPHGSFLARRLVGAPAAVHLQVVR